MRSNISFLFIPLSPGFALDLEKTAHPPTKEYPNKGCAQRFRHSLCETLRRELEFFEALPAAEIVEPLPERDNAGGLSPLDQFAADRVSDDIHGYSPCIQ
ncbi:MAG: hypothetical protein FD174_365 [Geobacteraceae bacterium]|nr:MAG: hypothetical protein FD174_365 [Geobacteraceae bacterium]